MTEDTRVKELIVFLAIILLIGASLVWGIIALEKNRLRERKESYAAWAKYSGNSQNLNYEEWEALRRIDEL